MFGVGVSFLHSQSKEFQPNTFHILHDPPFPRRNTWYPHPSTCSLFFTTADGSVFIVPLTLYTQCGFPSANSDPSHSHFYPLPWILSPKESTHSTHDMFNLRTPLFTPAPSTSHSPEFVTPLRQVGEAQESLVVLEPVPLCVQETHEGSHHLINLWGRGSSCGRMDTVFPQSFIVAQL